MPGGCRVCNPLCGMCQPALVKVAECPACGERTVFQRSEVVAAMRNGHPLACERCGLDLAELVKPAVVGCGYSGKLCAYPCGKSATHRRGGSFRPCEFNTQPTEQWFQAHPNAARKCTGDYAESEAGRNPHSREGSL